MWKRIVAKHGVKVEVCARFAEEQEALAHEVFLIACFKGMGYVLANLTDGGEGVSGLVFSEESRKRVSEVQKGRKRSPEAVEKTAQALRGRKRPRDVVEKIVAANAGYTHNAEAREKIKQARATQVITDAHKAAISAGNKGKKRTEAQKSAAVAARREKGGYANAKEGARKAWETKRAKALHAAE